MLLRRNLKFEEVKRLAQPGHRGVLPDSGCTLLATLPSFLILPSPHVAHSAFLGHLAP